MLVALDVAAVRRFGAAGVAALRTHRAEIDALNVFPVPDGDTGSNMLDTLRAGQDALAGTADAHDAATAFAALAGGAARGAIGNSGFLLSQTLRGLAEVGSGDYAGAALAEGLGRGATLARSAVVAPVDGTLLTVARAAADAARACVRSDDGPLVAVAEAAVAAATDALRRTRDQLPQLRAAGVVDAGGQGWLVLLEALAATIGAASVPRPAAPVPPVPPPHEVHTGFAYEVQYVLAAAPQTHDALRAALGRLGDSIALVPLDDATVKVHVHVDDAGAAIEAGLAAGRTTQISVVHLRPDTGHGGDGDPAAPQHTAVVAVAPGAGLAHLFRSEGVQVVDGSAGAPPTPDDVLAAVDAAGPGPLVLLPNAAHVTTVAEQAASTARLGGRRVAVVPTRSPVQGLAAIAVHDRERRFDDDVVAMAEAAAATRFAEITVARTTGLTAVGICQPGDVLGLIDGEVVEIGRGLHAVAFGLVDRLLGVGAELMTVLVGAAAPPRIGALVEAHVRDRAPFTDVVIYEGGQPDQPLIIGVE